MPCCVDQRAFVSFPRWVFPFEAPMDTAWCASAPCRTAHLFRQHSPYVVYSTHMFLSANSSPNWNAVPMLPSDALCEPGWRLDWPSVGIFRFGGGDNARRSLILEWLVVLVWIVNLQCNASLLGAMDPHWFMSSCETRRF